VDAWWSATARSPDELPGALLRLCGEFAGISPHDEARARLEDILP
jgi:hypothetical protein